jgi:hypothetical protein
MNVRSHMQGGKNCILPKECKPVLLGLSLDGDLGKPLMSLFRTEWRERGYGLRSVRTSIILRLWSISLFLIKILQYLQYGVIFSNKFFYRDFLASQYPNKMYFINWEG